MGIPKPHLRRFRLAEGTFFLENGHAFLNKYCLGQQIVNMLKTPNRRATHSCAEKMTNFVLNSHLDPIGNQNDVQQILIYCVYCAYLVLYLPTVLHIWCVPATVLQFN